MIASNKQGEVVLGGSPRLNLLPTAQQPTRGARQGTALLSILLITALIAGAGVAAAWFFSDQKAQELQAIEAETTRLQTEIDALSAVSEISREAVQIRVAKREMGTFIDAPALLSDLAALLPEGAYIEEYQQRFTELDEQQLVLTLELRVHRDLDVDTVIHSLASFSSAVSSRVERAELADVADGQFSAVRMTLHIETEAYSLEEKQ